MASSRTEIRVGQVTTPAGITLFSTVGGRVPAGKRWNLNLLVNNSTGGALTFSSSIVHRYADYGKQAEKTATVTTPIVGAVHPGGRWVVFAAGTSMYYARITPPGVVGPILRSSSSWTITDMKFNSTGDWLAVSFGSNPYLAIFAFSEVFGLGPYIGCGNANGAATGVAWHPGGAYIALSYSGSAVISAWPWSSTTGFGTKLTDSSNGFTATSNTALAFRPQGDIIVAGCTATPYIAAWPFTGTFGTKSNPTWTPSAAIRYLAWAPGGGALAMLTAATGSIQVTPWTTTWGSQVFDVGANVTTPKMLAAVDDYAFIGLGANVSGGEWSGVGGGFSPRSFTEGSLTNAAVAPLGVALDGGVAVWGGTSIIVLGSLIQPHTTSGGIGYICDAMSIAANSTAKLSGHILNEGERLIVAGSGALNVMASAVEITL